MNDIKESILKYRITYFKQNKNLSTWFGLPNRGDRLALPRIPAMSYNFSIPANEKVLFTRDISPWDTYDQGLVITNRALYYTKKNDDFVWFIDMNKIIDVYYTNKDSFMFISNDGDTDELSVNYFFYRTEGGSYYNQLAKYLKELIFYPYKEIFADKTHEEKSKLSKELLNLGIKVSIIYKNIADDYLAQGNHEEARMAYISAYCYSSNNEEKSGLIEKIDTIESSLVSNGEWNNIIEKPYIKRKYLTVMADSDFGKIDIKPTLLYRISNIPSSISFPFGHPTKNTLYIANPSNSSLYIPYEQSEEILFLESVHEYCDMLRGLGATEISITFEKGLSLDEMRAYSSNSKSEADLSILNGNISENRSGNFMLQNEEQSFKRITYKYDPIRKPFLHKGNWYNLNPNWQRLAIARLESNLLEYEEVFSTKAFSQVDKEDTEIFDVAAKLARFKLNGSYHEESSTNQKKKTNIETKWIVSVKFRSLKDW